jgi:hypothetical protein
VSIRGVREGIAANLDAIVGMHVLAYIPGNPSPPMAVVFPTRVTFDTAMARGSDEYEMAVRVIVSRADERGAQDTLDAFCDSFGPLSVKEAVESDRSLGGAAASLRLTDITDYGPVTIGETTFLAATFVVQVITL